MELDGNSVNMEIDTGAAVSIISEKVYQNCWTHLPLGTTRVNLKTYSGDKNCWGKSTYRYNMETSELSYL